MKVRVANAIIFVDLVWGWGTFPSLQMYSTTTKMTNWARKWWSVIILQENPSSDIRKNTRWAIKTCHFVFDHNHRVYWTIGTRFVQDTYLLTYRHIRYADTADAVILHCKLNTAGLPQRATTLRHIFPHRWQLSDAISEGSPSHSHGTQHERSSDFNVVQKLSVYISNATPRIIYESILHAVKTDLYSAKSRQRIRNVLCGEA